MPSRLDKIPIQDEHLDRRYKLSSDDRATVKEKYAQGMGIRAISRVYGVSHRLIQFILFPERLTRAKENYNWRNYYYKSKHTAQMRKHRAYKKELFNKGLLKGGEI